MQVSKDFTLDGRWVALATRRGKGTMPVSDGPYGDPILFTSLAAAEAVGQPVPASELFAVRHRLSPYSYEIEYHLQRRDEPFTPLAEQLAEAQAQIQRRIERARETLADLATTAAKLAALAEVPDAAV